MKLMASTITTLLAVVKRQYNSVLPLLLQRLPDFDEICGTAMIFSLYNGEASVVCPSICLSVNFCANRYFSQANGQIATKLSQDALQVSMHPGCAQGQGQRSRDTRTFLDSWNELLRH